MKDNMHPINARMLYVAEIRFTDEIDFGISMREILSGERAIPNTGARFDQSFEGTLSGPEIEGKIEGIDYLAVRPDWSFRLHLHGRITTRDGTRIAISSEGVSLQSEGSPTAQLRSAVTFLTAADNYLWLNQLQAWALGTMNPKKRTAQIQAYTAETN
jgi:hypothetical protein